MSIEPITIPMSIEVNDVTIDSTIETNEVTIESTFDAKIEVVEGGDISVQSLTVTENGTTTAPTGKAYSPVIVNVPNSYTNADEGKVVQNGALTSQTSTTKSANGTYDTTTNNQVTVSVPASAVDTGTKSISTNGTHDVVGYASAAVSVPNTYTASDEGKVVSSGALVSQTSATFTSNGTYDTTTNDEVVVNVSGGTPTLITKTITENGTYSAEDDNADGYSEVTVNVPSGGYSAKEFLYKQAPVGDVTIIADADIPTNNALSGRSSALTHLTIDLGSYKLSSTNGNGYQFQNNAIPVVTLISNNDTYAVPSYTFTSNSSPFTITMRGKWNGMANNAFRNNSGLTILDYTYTGSESIGQNAFYGDSNFGTFIIRSDHVLPLSNTNAFSNSTPFRSGGAGGTLYVPNDLISSYQSASNWSTILGYANNQIKSIESTHTDPTAPIDLTLYYADGTPIS